MDLRHLVPNLLLLLLLYIFLFLDVGVDAGKKHRHHKYPIKPLFGVGLGYKKVISYKPVLVFQKHKHVKLKRPHGWGWGGGGWGWRQGHRGHSGRGWGGGGGGHGHKHIDHHHFHHDGWGGGGGGGGGGDEGWGWGEDHEDDYGGWESNIRANWSSPNPSSDLLNSGGNSPLPAPIEMVRAHAQDFKVPEPEMDTEEVKNFREFSPSPTPGLDLNSNAKNSNQKLPRNFAYFNIGSVRREKRRHPEQNPIQAQAQTKWKGERGVRFEAEEERPTKRGVSRPVLPFYAEPFPNFEQFRIRASGQV